MVLAGGVMLAGGGAGVAVGETVGGSSPQSLPSPPSAIKEGRPSTQVVFEGIWHCAGREETD